MEPPAHIPYPHTVHFGALKKERLSQAKHQRAENLPSTFPTKAKYRGTIKLHGTNATIIFRNSNTKDATYQSRNRIITRDSDNQGTVALLSSAGVEVLVKEIIRINGSKTFKEIMIAGELGGKGIQKGVVIAKMERFFCIFNIRIDEEWVDMARYATVEIPKRRVFNIMNYKTFEVEIDITKDTREVYGQLMKYTMEVGAKCPFAASFVDSRRKPIIGVGEGIVWTLIPNDLHHPSLKSQLISFKTKAEAFITTTSQPKLPVNAGTTERATKFVDYAVSRRRLEQGVEYMREMKAEVDMKNFGEFLKWVIQDTLREEGEVMREMDADEKDVKKVISNKARVFWFDKCLDEDLSSALDVLDLEG